MKLRNTLILLALVAGLFAYIKWVDSKKMSTKETTEHEQRPAQFDQEKVTLVTIRNRDASVVQISQKDRVWRIEAPLKDRAQEFDVKGLLGELELLKLTRVSDTPPTKDQLKAYGLGKPEFTVKIDADQPVEISLGDETALHGTYYVKVEGRDLVYTARTSIREKLARKPEEWRNRTLSDVTPDAVRKVNIKTPKGEIELVKAGRYWSLDKPFKARADMQKVSDLLADTLNAQVQEFLTETKDASAFGLTEPRATVTFTPEGNEPPAVLEIGAAKTEKDDAKKGDKPDPNKATADKPADKKPATVYVKMTGREGVVAIPASIEALIAVQPNDLRDQNVMRIQPASVNRITIEAPGKEKVVLEKTLSKSQTSEEWVRKVAGKPDQPINTSAASGLLSTFAVEKVDHFVADMASDLKGFGLDQPQMTITFGDYSADNTAETNAGEREQARLSIGRPDGNTVYAKLSDEPFIFAILKPTIDNVWTDPIQWRPLFVKELPSQEITTLDVTHAGQPTVSLVRDGKTWKLAKGDGKVDQNAVEALVGTLANLHAVRWIGPTVAEHGLDKPSLTIAYTLADKKAGKLQAGVANIDKMWFASIDGEKATFLIAGPHFDALNAAVTSTPKPTADTPAPASNNGTSSRPPANTPPPVVVPPAEETPKPPTETTKPTEVPAGTKPPEPPAPKPSEAQ